MNYFFTTGTITIDPDIKYKGKGIAALIALLEERYPKRLELLILDLKFD